MAVRKKGWRFSFSPSACASCGGKCCTGESGDIWVDKKRMHIIAKFLGIEIGDFFQKYIRRKGMGFSLREVEIEPNNFACIFFDTEKKQCSIYEVRPPQCKSFPFWSEFKMFPALADEECPGVQLS